MNPSTSLIPFLWDYVDRRYTGPDGTDWKVIFAFDDDVLIVPIYGPELVKPSPRSQKVSPLVLSTWRRHGLAEILTDNLSDCVSRVFTPIGNLLMNSYIRLQPHSDIESVLFAAIGFGFLCAAVHFNNSP